MKKYFWAPMFVAASLLFAGPASSFWVYAGDGHIWGQPTQQTGQATSTFNGDGSITTDCSSSNSWCVYTNGGQWLWLGGTMPAGGTGGYTTGNQAAPSGPNVGQGQYNPVVNTPAPIVQ